MDRLKDKVAVITGAAGGIGRATASLYAAEGAKVVLVDLDQAALEDVAKSLNNANVMCIAADVTKADDVQRYVQETVKRFGRIDIHFSNAGIEGKVAPIVEYPDEMFDKVMAVNVRGVWLGMKAVMPIMEKNGGGSIVITSSVAGMRGYAGLSAYVTSKHAVVGLMRTAVMEGTPKGIRVNTINPSPIDTRMMRALEEGTAPEAPADVRTHFESLIPAQRYGTPDEVANLALFLGSDESRFISGGVYTVDGGMTAG